MYKINPTKPIFFTSESEYEKLFVSLNRSLKETKKMDDRLLILFACKERSVQRRESKKVARPSLREKLILRVFTKHDFIKNPDSKISRFLCELTYVNETSF